MTVHDYSGLKHWAKEVDGWKDEFKHNDVVVSLDAQERLGENTFLVSRVSFQNPHEKLHHLGLFWTKGEAMKYARSFSERVNRENYS